MTSPILSVEGVNTFYGTSHVLQDVSVSANPKEIVGLLGRNGVGKTTLVRSIMGLTPPQSGTILFKGEDIIGESPDRVANRGIGYVPQNRRMFQDMTVLENLRMGAGTADFNQERLERVFELFPRVEERLSQRAGTLSGGEQQMVAIGRALIRDPELVLMDEPTEGLMPALIPEITDAIAELADRGYTIVLVEQNVDLVLTTCDRVYFMDKGRVVHETPVEQLHRDPTPIERHLGVALAE